MPEAKLGQHQVFNKPRTGLDKHALLVPYTAERLGGRFDQSSADRVRKLIGKVEVAAKIGILKHIHHAGIIAGGFSAVRSEGGGDRKIPG